jgi:hypothetical protein
MRKLMGKVGIVDRFRPVRAEVEQLKNDLGHWHLMYKVWCGGKRPERTEKTERQLLPRP